MEHDQKVGAVKVAIAWLGTLVGTSLHSWVSLLVVVATLIFTVMQIYKVRLEIKKLQRDEESREHEHHAS